MQSATRSRLTLTCILVTILLDMIGVGIIVPVLPELLEELTGGSVAQAAVIGGYLVFAYAFMQFVFSPVLGNLSDRFGRRPILLASLLGLTFDYLMMSIAPFVWYLFIGRIIAGIAGAALATATAYMADITPPHKRTHRFGLIGAAFGLGFIIGPVIGGELGEFGPRVPFYAAAGLAFANFLFGLFVLPESLPKASRRKFDIRRANPLGAVLALRKYPSVLWLLGVLFFFQLSAQALPTVFSYFTVEVFNFSSSMIGRTLGGFGLGFAISQAVIAGPLSKGIGEPAVAMIGLLAAVAAFAGVGMSGEVYQLYLFILVGTVSGLAPPAINGVLSRQVPDNSQGELQGAVNAASSLATIIGPLAATQIFSYYTTTPETHGYFPGAPFVAASVSVALALILFGFTAWRFELGRRPSIADHPHTPEMAPPGQVRVPPLEDDPDTR
ncbi:MAG: TCR/Tet family MFS transporter [Devosia sp.]|jgi:DHA1 family tetracycline resistance protein-like MFS transporter|uniref:TCR/Tet family MFS transporter n=1 Tax=unclassified Devosia TaxID=196773 RepID=UPI0019D8F279|nr:MULTISPECIES: TCR/Tet family MFS transporter [unclassified Devosia]MBF0680218.1 TCR/Tet family MFS transporter [Devosia sp.]WEJ34909.1 TCR/Tet family MFS transporter [Devosia sp. SD17-2]